MVKLLDILKEIRVVNPSAVPTHLPFRYDSKTWPRIAKHLNELEYIWAYDGSKITPSNDDPVIQEAKEEYPGGFDITWGLITTFGGNTRRTIMYSSIDDDIDDPRPIVKQKV